MATRVESTVGTGGDYADWDAWLAAAPTNLVTADQVWVGKQLNQEFVRTTTFTISGKTTDATRYFEMTTAVGCSFRDHASKATNPGRYNASVGASIRCTSSSATINIQQSYTRVNGLQISNSNTGSTAQPAFYTSGAAITNVYLDDCIFEGYGVNSAIKGVVRLTMPSSRMRNCQVLQLKNDAAAQIATLSGGPTVVNCTFANLGATALTAGIATASVAAVMKNCYVGGVVAPEDGVLAATKTNCYSNATATGYSVAALSTSTFENITIGTHDMRLKSGSTLINAGVTDATNAPADILGVSRPVGAAYDVGAWEYVAAGTTISCTVGAAAADGLTASIFQALVINCTVGNATADGRTASLGGTLTISATVGAATANGLTATVTNNASGGFTSDILTNNTGTVLAFEPVAWSWVPSGRIGSMAGKSAQDGTGTTNASGRLVLTGLTVGAGVLWIAALHTSAADDDVYYEAGTVS